MCSDNNNLSNDIAFLIKNFCVAGSCSIPISTPKSPLATNKPSAAFVILSIFLIASLRSILAIILISLFFTIFLIRLNLYHLEQKTLQHNHILSESDFFKSFLSLVLFQTERVLRPFYLRLDKALTSHPSLQ